MKDYSAMSDFEINKKVAIELELKPYYEDGSYSNDGLSVVTRGPRCLGRWNPCNEPHQAWPIILSKGISLMFDGEWQACAGLTMDNGGLIGWDYYCSDAKPLKAAMIVYLQMMEAKS